MNAFLVYRQFLSGDGKIRMIGGIETYIASLSKVLSNNGIIPIVCQRAELDFVKHVDGLEIRGFKAEKVKDIVNKILKVVKKDSDIIIFMSDDFSMRLNGYKTLSIQHGISWDIPVTGGFPLYNMIFRINTFVKTIKWFEYCNHSVCVDYNFYNWYKTIKANGISKRLSIIPNFCTDNITFSELEKKIGKSDSNINIIFARRFYRHRGAIDFCETMSKILGEYPQVKLTIAGEGPCEAEMKNILANFHNQVSFIKYLPEDSKKIHLSQDIAVIPTLGSEGTSLSLLEAMGAGCLVVATPVGGISNIVIDNYNGIMSLPEDRDSLYLSIKRAISIYKKGTLQKHALETITSGFSFELWAEKWTNVIQNIVDKQ